MDEVIKYIEEFVKSEYETNDARYDVSVDDLSYLQIAEKTESFFHSTAAKKYARTGREFSSEMHILSSERNRERHVVRTIFQIKSYEGSIFGSILKKHVTGNLVYSADVSYDQRSRRPLYYANRYYMADTDEGLKIIYFKVYEIEPPVWVDAHDFEPKKVLKDGILKEVVKINPPEFEPCLKDYLSEIL